MSPSPAHPTLELAAAELATVQAAEAKLLLQTYERNPILLVAGRGLHLIDDQGIRYLDLLSGIGVNALGYSHPAIEHAIADQSTKLIHTSNLYYHTGQADLASRLTRMTGMDRAFFSNSGTEAWEAALKLARLYAGRERTAGKKLGTKFLALDHSFHGRTMGSVATTEKEKYRLPFMPVMPGVDFVAFNDVAALRAAFTDEHCAVCLEAVQGEGGIRPVSREFMDAARELTRSTGALLIVDEIQAGLGRTGRWCAYQHYNVQPDITTLAKPLAGGLPLGAMLCTGAVASAMQPGLHGTTFGGGPLACAVAIAVIDTIEQENLLAHITEVGDYFHRQLDGLAAKYPQLVLEARGLGLMLALELRSADTAKSVAAAMLGRRFLINRTSETVLRFLPPYILATSHVDLAIAALDEILEQHAPTESGATGGTLIGR
jgi:acetylornithine/N-succinyldiaminopimelate aminotransferase